MSAAFQKWGTFYLSKAMWLFVISLTGHMQSTTLILAYMKVGILPAIALAGPDLMTPQVECSPTLNEVLHPICLTPS